MSDLPFRMNMPAKAGYCAWDSDECWVMVAVDTKEDLNALLRQLTPRKRIRVVEDGETA